LHEHTVSLQIDTSDSHSGVEPSQNSHLNPVRF